MELDKSGGKVALRDEENNLLAVMDVEDSWRPDKNKEAELVFGGDSVHLSHSHKQSDTHKHTLFMYVYIYLSFPLHAVRVMGIGM